MISNSETITIIHKSVDPATRLEMWTKRYYNKCWWHAVDGSIVRNGYEYNNRVDVRIPYSVNKDANITDISIRRYTL